MNDQIKGLSITTLGILFVAPDALFVRLINADPLVIAFWRTFLTGAVLLIGLLFLNGTSWTPLKTYLLGVFCDSIFSGGYFDARSRIV